MEINDHKSRVNDNDFQKRVYGRSENIKNISKNEKFVRSRESFSLFTYFFFILIRIALVFIPQYGYIHPDEFFQTTEVITGNS